MDFEIKRVPEDAYYGDANAVRVRLNLDQSEVSIVDGVVLTSKLIVTAQWRKLSTSDPR